MQFGTQNPVFRAEKLDPLLIGVVCGLISAAAYTACNVCLRRVAEHADAVWVSCVKAMPVALVSGVMVLIQTRSGACPWPSRHMVWRLAAMALFMQLAGNVAFQWAMGQIGLAVVVPLSFGAILVGAALLGRLWLAEPVTARTAGAMLVVVVAMGVLSLAARGSGGTAERVSPPMTVWVGLGVGAGCLAGLAYGASSVMVRQAVVRGMTLSATLAIMSGTGVLALGVVSSASIGPSRLLQTPADELAYMLLAGLFNALAFYALAKSLQLMTAVHANLLGASQVAMAAIAGVAFFGETLSIALIVGVVLTGVGLLIVGRGRGSAAATARPGTPGAATTLALSASSHE